LKKNLLTFFPCRYFAVSIESKMATEERKLPEILEHDFVICDNTLNRKGWRLLVEGIDMEGFLKNPVCCVQHDTWMVPIGKWKNLRIEDGKFLGTVEFDRNDPDAIKLYWKYADGYMNAVSLHVISLEESDVPTMLVPGQRYSTITKSELLEISLVTVPGQKNAVKLSTPDGQDYQLNLINKMEKEEKTQTQTEDLQKQVNEQKQLSAKNLVKIHQLRGVVQDGEVEHLSKLAIADYDTTEKMLEARQPEKRPEEEKPETVETESKKLSDQMKDFTKGLGSEAGKKTAADDRAGWSFYDWFRKDSEGLSLMQKSDPERYKKLESAQYASAKKSGLHTEEMGKDE
jgi:phage head maturation protease